MGDIIWWALILGTLAYAALLTWIFLKLGNVNSFGTGAGIGATVGLFTGLSIDLMHYATVNDLDLTGLFADVVVGIIISAITAGIIGAVLGMGKKKA